MTDKHSFILWLLVLSLAGASGCAQKMTKEDNVMPPATAQPIQQEGNIQVADAAPVSGVAQATSNDVPAQATPAVAKEPTADEAAAAAALLPLPPREIVDTIKKLTTHPRVRYLSRSAQYDYYVGGKIDAEYDIKKNELVVTNAPTEVGDTVTCEYTKEGKMISGKKGIPSRKVAECNQLINELTTYLAK